MFLEEAAELFESADNVLLAAENNGSLTDDEIAFYNMMANKSQNTAMMAAENVAAYGADARILSSLPLRLFWKNRLPPDIPATHRSLTGN